MERLRPIAFVALLLALLAPAGRVATAQCTLPQGAVVPASAPLDLGGLRVGIALGSGSSHGLAHIGIVQGLEAKGLDPRVVTGTSVGALVGALWASGLGGREIESASESWNDWGRFAPSWQGVFSNDPIQRELGRIFQGRPIEAWPRRFGAVATNMANGHRRILTAGDGALAVQASSAVPVFFAPVTVDGEKLADGALVEPVPVDAARALGADFVIAVDVAYRPYEERASGLTQYAFQSMHILINSLASQQIKGADVAIRLDVHHTLMNCGRAAMIAEGREAVRRAWPEIARALAGAAQRHAARWRNIPAEPPGIPPP